MMVVFIMTWLLTSKEHCFFVFKTKFFLKKIKKLFYYFFRPVSPEDIAAVQKLVSSIVKDNQQFERSELVF